MSTTRINGTDVSVKQEGKVIIIPAGMPLIDAHTAIGREITSQEENVQVNATMPGIPDDAANALQLGLHEEFGFVAAKKDPWGNTSNTSRQVQTGPNEFTAVPWGKFTVPGIEDGYLVTSVTQDEFGRATLLITGIVKRKFENRVINAITLAKGFLNTHSIYKGKAVEIRLRDDGGNFLEMPEIKFVPLNAALREQLTYRKDVQADIDVNVFEPIENWELLREMGVPLKRGVLFYGPYGTGKTMAMGVAAHMAVENGWTFAKVRADELADVIRLMRGYGRLVVSSEDVDAVAAGERSITLNDLLETIDGIDAKDSEVMVLLTTNHAERINKALLRAGRLDAAIQVLPPDADACERLMRRYGRAVLDPNSDITAAAELMAGSNAGDVREVVERSKIAAGRRIRLALGRKPRLDEVIVTGEDLLTVATAMHNGELQLRRELVEDTRSELVKAAHVQAEATRELAAAYERSQPTDHLTANAAVVAIGQ